MLILDYIGNASTANNRRGYPLQEDIEYKKLTLWEIGNIGFNGLAKPIDALSNVTHIS